MTKCSSIYKIYFKEIEGEGEGDWKDWENGRLGVKTQYKHASKG